MTRMLGLFATGVSTAVVLCAASAYAQSPGSAAGASSGTGEFSAIDTRIISDPLFLPRAGQVYGASVFTLDRPTGTNTRNGVETGSFTASNSLFDQTIAYGLTNAFTLRVALGHASHSRDSTSAATGDVTTGNAGGFDDPTFSATYRILDEVKSPLVLDVTGSYSPNIFTAETSGGGLDGTVARGGQNTGLSATVGREMTGFTIAGTVTTTYVGQQTTELLSNSTSTLSDGHWSYDLGFDTQTRFTKRLSLNGGVTFSSAGNYGVSNIQSGNAHTYDAPATVAANLAVNYHLVPNRLVGSFTYTYDTYTAATNIFSNTTSDTAVRNRTGNVIGVRLLYTFN